MTMKLWTNGVDTYIAEFPEDIPALYKKATGDSYDPEEYEPWIERVGDPISIWLPDPHSGERVTKTASEWIAEYGPGFLCSTEF